MQQTTIILVKVLYFIVLNVKNKSYWIVYLNVKKLLMRVIKKFKKKYLRTT